MVSFLQHNSSIVISTDNYKYRTNVYRANENIYVFNLINYLKSIYSKDELLQAENSILKNITEKKRILDNCIKVLTLDINSNFMSTDLFDSLESHEHYGKVENYINKLLFRYDKDKKELTEVELLICEILSMNSSSNDLKNRDFDLVLELSDPLEHYYRKLNWLEYRFNHFFYLLTTENIININEYHINFITFLLQFNYNVFHFYYNYYNSFSLSKKTIEEYDYIIYKSLQETDNLFNNIFDFTGNLREYKYYSNFIDLIKTLQLTYKRDQQAISMMRKYNCSYSLLHNMYYDIKSVNTNHYSLFTWPHYMSTNESENSNGFIFATTSNNVIYCDYENKMLDLTYLNIFVDAFFKVSLRTSNFKDNEHKYGRFFSKDSSYIYRELDVNKDEKIYFFNSNQAFNYNKNWKWPKKK